MTDPVQQVVLASSNLEKSVAYWKDLAGMTVYSKTDKSATLGYSETQAKLVLQDIGKHCCLEYAQAVIFMDYYLIHIFYFCYA